MRTSFWMGALLCVSSAAGAQQVPDSTTRAHQRSLDSLSAALKVMQDRVDSLAAAAATAPPPAPRASGAYMNVSFVGLTTAGWSSTPNVRGIMVGDHDARVRGFTIPNAELALDGAIDPYFKGIANIVYHLDENGETIVEMEEMYFLTTSLPHNIQVKGGQFFAEFGRQNPTHPHSWAFADDQLVLGRFLGPEGLRSQGIRVSWLAPTSFYTEATLAVMNSAGGTTASFRSDESSGIHGGVPFDRVVRGAGDMLYVPRLATSFDLTGTQTIVVGASGAFGPNNSGPDARTRIVGVDAYWKWKSPRASQGFPFVAVQTEALARRYDTDARVAAANPLVTLTGQVLNDRGAYAQVQWGIRPMLVAAVRAEAIRNGDKTPAVFQSEERISRSRYSTNLTWFPSEYSKLRIQYNYDRRNGMGNDHSLWMQFEFLLGAHAAHKF